MDIISQDFVLVLFSPRIGSSFLSIDSLTLDNISDLNSANLLLIMLISETWSIESFEVVLSASVSLLISVLYELSLLWVFDTQPVRNHQRHGFVDCKGSNSMGRVWVNQGT